MDTTTVAGIELVAVGTTNEGQIYVCPFESPEHANAVADALEAQGYEHVCRKTNEGPWAFGWVQTGEPEVNYEPLETEVTVDVASDSSDKTYQVTVHVAGDKTLGCTCPAGKFGTPCKHLYRGRVKALGTFKKAAEALIKSGKVADDRMFLKQFEQRREEIGTNAAIAAVITAVMGPDHPHATPSKK